MLKFNGTWRFDTPGAIPAEVVTAFFELIRKVATQGERQRTLEHFKSFFGSAAGISGGWSSSVSFAEYDLQTYMDSAAANAPLFIEAFYDACVALAAKHPEIAVPDVTRINRILFESQAGYEIQPPDLISSNTPQIIPVPQQAPSLDEQAQDLIQQSLNHSERLLSEGLSRQAVQEALWLLETVSTAFKGLETDAGTIQGKYFNKIAEDLRNSHRGQSLEQILSWMTTLHGYLSSPTGGGIRHGADLKNGVATQPNEARLYCNLIRSYISFLIAEHERLSKT
jgi:hypothetical protein